MKQANPYANLSYPFEDCLMTKEEVMDKVKHTTTNFNQYLEVTKLRNALRGKGGTRKTQRLVYRKWEVIKSMEVFMDWHEENALT